MYDVIIIGGGPAGCSAGIYAGRKKLNTLLLTDTFGGQSIVSDSIENWIGSTAISGYELAQNLEKHVRVHDEVEVKTGVLVEKIEDTKEGLVVKTKTETFETKFLMLANGARRRRLGIPGEEKFDGKGVAYCSTCDAPLYKNKRVAVVGAGNAGLEAVIDLESYAEKIYLLNRGEELAGDQETQDEVNKITKLQIINQAEPLEVVGESVVNGFKYKDLKSGEINKLELDGVFVEIGSVPNSEIVDGLVDLNEHKEVVVDHKTYATSHPRIYAAGDVTDEIYKQNNIAAGDAITAILSIYSKLSKKK